MIEKMTGLLLICGSVLLATTADLRNKSIQAIPLNGHAVNIDGKLGEPVWQQAPKGNKFIQRNPEDGANASLQTEFSVTYDEEFLYVGVRAWDDHPEEIVRILSRRDEYVPSDEVYISIDSFDDNRTAFEFGVNPEGVKHDLRRYNDNNADEDWDAVWFADAKVDDQGWTAELAIPFRELRFNSASDMKWGFMVYREIPRFNSELDIWSYFSKEDPGFVTYYGVLEGLQNIESTNPLYIAPYIVGEDKISSDLKNDLHPETYDVSNSLGADIRYTFSNGLTMNATLNPDFGQVEADPATFNLTQYETYYSENRPFFMEGANILDFQLGIGDGDLGNNKLFYSRRIGRAPQGYINNYDYYYAERPSQTSIIGAAKLTGKTESGMSVAVMNATTSEEEAVLHFSADSTDHQVIEPRTNYFISRLQKDFFSGGSNIGIYITATNRALNGTGMEDLLRSAAYTGGIDFQHQFLDRKYCLEGYLAFSYVEGNQTAIYRTQTNSVHLFQRSDADYMDVDTSATSLDGYGYALALSKQSGHVRAAAGVVGYSPGFEPNDLGYLRKADLINEFLWVSYQEWRPKWIFKSYNINFNQWLGYTYGNELISNGGNINGNVTFKNQMYLGGGYNLNFPVIGTDLLHGGPAVVGVANRNIWIYFSTDDRKMIDFSTQPWFWNNDDGITSRGVYTGLDIRLARNLKLSIETEYERFHDTWTWVDYFNDSQYKDHFIFSNLDQESVTSTARFDITITPELTVQF